jgi:regulatory protein
VKSSDSESFEKGRQYSFLLLRYRDRSEKEIEQRLLKKGFTVDIACKVRDYLREYGFIDDAKFALTLKRIAVEQKRLGKAGIFRYLVSKGIPAEMGRDLSGEDTDYEESAAIFIQRRMKQYEGLDEQTVKRRLWAALARKGYSPDVIKRALKKYYDAEELIS